MVDVELTGELIGDEHILGVGYTKDDHIVVIEDNLRLRGGSWANKAWDAYDQFQQFKKRRYYDQYLVAARDREIMGYNTPRGPGQSYDIHYEYNPRKVRKDLGRAGLLSAAVIARRLRKRLRRAEDKAKAKAHSGGEPKVENLSKKMAPPLRDTVQEVYSAGAGILARNMSSMRMYHTLQRYQMSVSRVSSDIYKHYVDEGQGPCLYSVYDYTAGSASSRSWTFNQPKNIDCQYAANYVGANSPVYIFAADWPWQIMNHDTTTQTTLLWKYDTITPTTDPNLPITLTDFITNKDWQYIRIFRVRYIFDFCNFDMRKYCVEILLFKYVADPDAMDYQQQATAPFSKQDGGFQEYCTAPSRIWGHPDIKIIRRHRIILGGMDNNYAQLDGSAQKSWAVTKSGTNSRRFELDVDREYVIKRPILGSYASLSEAEFFKTYYEASKGIYCRIQAWPMAINAGINRPLDSATIDMYKGLDDLCLPAASLTGATIAPGVDVRIQKKGYFKFDAPRIKSLS